ncbi:MAG TPA: polysaccharide deacetylase [Vitreimonas sp.]|nr:polysaccharide deacetylase [Vitreimonas sp.]
MNAATAPRLTVALTVDHDALSDAVRRGDSVVKLSHAEFGPRVGAPRLLELFAREGIPTTWFLPGHTLETFPDQAEAIRAGGHELGTHGWYHEDFAELSRDEQREVLERSRDAVARLTGERVQGFRAPYWSLGSETLALVEAAGYRYDSSLMAGDARVYRVRHGDRHSVAEGTSWGRDGSLLEVPVYWAMDDWPHFEPGPTRDGLSAPSKVLEIWTEEVRWAWEHEPGGIVMVTFHPECIGRGHRMRLVERFIAACRELDGVVFDRLDRYLDQVAPVTD